MHFSDCDRESSRERLPSFLGSLCIKGRAHSVATSLLGFLRPTLYSTYPLVEADPFEFLLGMFGLRLYYCRKLATVELSELGYVVPRIWGLESCGFTF